MPERWSHFFFVKKLSTENFVRKEKLKKKIHNFSSLCFLRKDDDVTGWREESERWYKCNVWRGCQKIDFFGWRHFCTAPYGINRIRLEGVDMKNCTHRTWGVYAFIGVGGERWVKNSYLSNIRQSGFTIGRDMKKYICIPVWFLPSALDGKFPPECETLYFYV